MLSLKFSVRLIDNFYTFLRKLIEQKPINFTTWLTVSKQTVQHLKLKFLIQIFNSWTNSYCENLTKSTCDSFNIKWNYIVLSKIRLWFFSKRNRKIPCKNLFPVHQKCEMQFLKRISLVITKSSVKTKKSKKHRRMKNYDLTVIWTFSDVGESLWLCAML